MSEKTSEPHVETSGGSSSTLLGPGGSSTSSPPVEKQFGDLGGIHDETLEDSSPNSESPVTPHKETTPSPTPTSSASNIDGLSNFGLCSVQPTDLPKFQGAAETNHFDIVSEFLPLGKEPFHNAKDYRYYHLPSNDCGLFSEFSMIVRPVPKDTEPLHKYIIWMPGTLVSYYHHAPNRQRGQGEVLDGRCVIISLGHVSKQPSALLLSLERKKLYPDPIHLTDLDPISVGKISFCSSLTKQNILDLTQKYEQKLGMKDDKLGSIKEAHEHIEQLTKTVNQDTKKIQILKEEHRHDQEVIQEEKDEIKKLKKQIENLKKPRKKKRKLRYFFFSCPQLIKILILIS